LPILNDNLCLFHTEETRYEKKLSELPVGAKGKITGFYQDSVRCRERLASIGLTPITIFEILRIAPMGDPVEIKARGYKISLRLDVEFFKHGPYEIELVDTLGIYSMSASSVPSSLQR